MSQADNAEVAGTMMNLLQRGDRDALNEMIRERVHPEIEWVPLIAEGVEGGYRGRRGIQRFLDDYLNSFEVRYEEVELRAIDDRVVLALCRMDLRGRESGIEISRRVGTVFEFDDRGLLRRGRVYDDQGEAIVVAEASRAGEPVQGVSGGEARPGPA